jgi:hypothetical protein
MNILAGTVQRLTFADGEFKPDPDGAWAIKSLNYWQTQECYPLAGAEFIRAALQRGLVEVPGETVEAFIANPAIEYVHPLNAAIWALTRGN